MSCASSAEDSPVVATRWQLLQKHQTEGLVVFALIWASEKNTLGSLGCQRLSAQPQAGNLKLFVSEFNTHVLFCLCGYKGNIKDHEVFRYFGNLCDRVTLGKQKGEASYTGK